MRTTLLPGLLGAVARQPRPPGRARRPCSSMGRSTCRGLGAPTAGAGARAQGHPPAVAARRAARRSASRSAGRSRPRAGRARRGPPTSSRSRASSSACWPASQIGRRRASSARAEPYLHPGKSADLLLGDERVGSLGLLRPDVAGALRHRGPATVYVAELAVAPLAARGLAIGLFEDLAHLPAGQPGPGRRARRRRAGRRRSSSVVRRAGGRLLREASVFDVYEGDQVPPGKRSLAVRLVLRSAERTLTDKDIAGVRRKVLAALERELGATLRQLERSAPPQARRRSATRPLGLARCSSSPERSACIFCAIRVECRAP